MNATATRKPRKTFSPAERAAWLEEKQARTDSALGDILAMFESGELPDAIGQTMIARAEGSTPAAKWSLPNQLLMLKAGTSDGRGFRQWQQVGRSVNKGARAFRIFGPMLKKRTDTDAQGNETEKRVLIGYTLIPVFRVQDTSGEPIASTTVRPVNFPPLYDVAERLGVRVDYLPSHRLATYRGYYSPDRKEIALLTTDERTFFHELAHAAHDRVLLAAGKSIADVKEVEAETVAEVVAATLCRLHGLDGYVFHGYTYVQQYAADGNAARAAVRVLGDVQKVLALILEESEIAT